MSPILIVLTLLAFVIVGSTVLSVILMKANHRPMIPLFEVEVDFKTGNGKCLGCGHVFAGIYSEEVLEHKFLEHVAQHALKEVTK